jgi:hypothetical protein
MEKRRIKHIVDIVEVMESAVGINVNIVMVGDGIGQSVCIVQELVKSRNKIFL